MCNESRRQCVEFEVAHAVGTYYHCRLLLFKGIHYALQRVGAAVEVVAVELHGEASASTVVYRHVPAAAYAEVVPFGHYVYKLRVGCVLF